MMRPRLGVWPSGRLVVAIVAIWTTDSGGFTETEAVGVEFDPTIVDPTVAARACGDTGWRSTILPVDAPNLENGN